VAERLRHHQAAGHRVILLSASPDLYVPAVGRALGIAEVVSTRVAVAGGRCAGHIVGDNCKGENKLEALRRHLGGDVPPPGSFAYGDSRSDLPVLRWVASGYLVRRGRLVEVK
jgi:phosphatidylglycerophosphatase C